ncbi:hypothetical protein CSOJ01_05704 [Colletotrichum sojae]|uniref:YEATS domain-containing protein n=1 Tax=Colletotrichum sojae TaxID=2175907 RepID=A0A8H6MWC4_9PEZI|nr:hypothetical protein CSOJ01_05704 [Colletotrichum sojae]
MDALSISTGCLALITAVAQAGSGIASFVTTCREARQDLAAVSAELAELGVTLTILKNDTDDDAPARLPEDLRRRICDLIANCDGVIVELAALLEKHRGGGTINSAARWALSGKKEAAKIKASLEAHKGALALVVEATTLHMATVAATDIGKVAVESSLIKQYTMKIVEQLAKQDEILEQIAWIRGVISQRSPESQDRTLVLDGYLDTLTNYAGSVCGDSVADEIAEEMRRGSDTDRTGTTWTMLDLAPIKPLVTFNDQPDPMTLVIGNTHRLVTPKEGTENRHLWSFYVKASGEEIIQEMRIGLHRTFSPPHVLLTTPPYKITRIGWGYFIIDVTIWLKPGYRWCEGNKRSLYLEWKLDFKGVGSSQSYEYTVTQDQ